MVTLLILTAMICSCSWWVVLMSMLLRGAEMSTGLTDGRTCQRSCSSHRGCADPARCDAWRSLGSVRWSWLVLPVSCSGWIVLLSMLLRGTGMSTVAASALCWHAGANLQRKWGIG